MNTLVLNSYLWLPLDSISQAELESLKTRLTIIPKVSTAYDSSARPEPIPLFEIRDGMIGIPRNYGLQRFAQSALGTRRSIDDFRTDEYGSIDFKFKAELWDTQKGPVEQMLKGLKEGVSNGGLLNSPCGSGKSVMAMKLIAELKAPTMIILHDEGLLEQWKTEVKKFLNVKESEIGRVQGDICNFEGKKIVFAVTQSLHARKDSYPTALYTYPTVVVYDEIHRTGARSFCTWMGKVRAKYRIGLSATLRRWDGAEDIFLHHIGDVLATGVANRMVPQIYQVYIPKCCPDISNKTGQLLIPTMLSKLAGSRTPRGKTKAVSKPNSGSIKRNAYIVKDIVDAIKKNRTVLVLSLRIPQLQEIERSVKARTNATIGYYIGGMSADKKKVSKKCNLILATYKMGSEGMDIPTLDTLIMAMPVSDVEQSVGRVLRYADDKLTPLVIDYIDPNTAFTGMAHRRETFYRANGYPIKKIRRS